MSDLHWWSATELAAAIRERKVSSSEALEHLVARIESLDGPRREIVRARPWRTRASGRKNVRRSLMRTTHR